MTKGTVLSHANGEGKKEYIGGGFISYGYQLVGEDKTLMEITERRTVM